MPRITQDLSTVTVTLRSGRVDRYRGVYAYCGAATLHVYTFDYLDPADWRDPDRADVRTAVISYALAAVESWTERPYDGPPYIIPPEPDVPGAVAAYDVRSAIQQALDEAGRTYRDALAQRGIDLEAL
jgi:hypothetical protein